MYKKLKIAHLNVRSLVPHLQELREALYSHDIDIIALSETWLFSARASNDLLQIRGFTLIRRDFDRRGSGLAFYIRSDIEFKLLTHPASGEYLCLAFDVNSIKFVLCDIYRNHGCSYRNFVDDLENIISSCASKYEYIFLLGDVNIDLVKRDDPVTIYYQNFLNNLSLVQLINEPTRYEALLDHIIAFSDDIVDEAGVVETNISDHDIIYLILDI